MITIIYLASLASLVHSGIITHDLGGDDGIGKATSYQTIHMEHFHAVPTFIKKEYKHLLEHPLPAGKSSSKIEVHHGGKHDHGYAIVDAKNNAHGSGGHDDAGFHGHEGFGGHEDGGLSASLSGHGGASLGGHEGAILGGHDVANEGGGDASGHLAAQAIASAALAHGTSGGYQVHDQNQELLQHQAEQIAQSHGALQLQALSQGVGSSHGGIALGHYQAAAAADHQGFEAALANVALHLQNSLAGHGHS